MWSWKGNGENRKPGGTKFSSVLMRIHILECNDQASFFYSSLDPVLLPLGPRKIHESRYTMHLESTDGYIVKEEMDKLGTPKKMHSL